MVSVCLATKHGNPLGMFHYFLARMGEKLRVDNGMFDHGQRDFDFGGQPLKFEATGTCYLEFGDGEMEQIMGNFLGDEQPQVALEQPSAESRADKDHLALFILLSWVVFCSASASL